MKISIKILALMAMIGQIYFGAFAMDGIADNEVNGIAETSNMKAEISGSAAAVNFDIMYP